MECSRDPVIVTTFYSCHFYLKGRKNATGGIMLWVLYLEVAQLKKVIDQICDPT